MSDKQHSFPLTKDYLLKEYEDVFTGIGCYSGAPYHIETDPEVPPVQHAPRQVPVQLQQAYMEELDQLKKWGTLSTVRNEHIPWVNSTVVTIKPNGSIRLCLDPRNLNKAVKQNPYYVRTIDDVTPKVIGSTYFSILDARSGFWQVNLDKESSRLCTFNTPRGKYRWTRLHLTALVAEMCFKRKWTLSEIRCWRYALRLWSRVSFKFIDRLVMCLRVRRARC